MTISLLRLTVQGVSGSFSYKVCWRSSMAISKTISQIGFARNYVGFGVSY